MKYVFNLLWKKSTYTYIHQLFENLFDRQIKKARAQAKSQRPAEKIPRHRIRTQQRQLDHFLEFTMRPYYYQDVSYGTRTIKLKSVVEFFIPNMVRTVAKCTIIINTWTIAKRMDLNR